MGNIINIKFKKPKHGWLPIKLSSKGTSLLIDASDSYVDSIEVLVDALIMALNGQRSEVSWYMEPAEYKQVFDVYENLVSTRIVDFKGAGFDNPELFRWDGQTSELVGSYLSELEKISTYENAGSWSWHYPAEKVMKLRLLLTADLVSSLKCTGKN